MDWLGIAWSFVKRYSALFAAGGLALLVGWLKVLSHQKDKAEASAERAKRTAEAAKENLRRSRRADRASQKVRNEGQDVEREIEKRSESGERPSGRWLDRRLRNKD